MNIKKLLTLLCVLAVASYADAKIYFAISKNDCKKYGSKAEWRKGKCRSVDRPAPAAPIQAPNQVTPSTAPIAAPAQEQAPSLNPINSPATFIR